MPSTSKKQKKPTEDQAERFERTARDLGVEVDEENLKRTLRRMREAPDRDDKPKKDKPGQ